MRRYEFDGNFLYYVRLIKKLYEQTLQRVADDCGLSLPETDVLSFLRENPGFDTACDIALYREVSRAYVSKAVESLAAKGYLHITKDKADRRYQHLTITEKAEPLAEKLHHAQFMFYETVTKGLTDTEFNAMLAAIEKCANNLAEVTAG
ncbi:MAG: MarR family winged helix-turn-helix transcriptional regulator [Coriobacteriia bacterium]|nr:MarR family winged helix-turn-helix transcriptional regulator [Coriobacteriia bacterium]